MRRHATPPPIGGHSGRPCERAWRAWRAYSKTCAELPTRLVRISSRETYATSLQSMTAPPSGGVQLIGGVQRAHREFGVFGRHQHADLDLGGRDHLDVYPLAGEGLEHLERHAGMAAHADTD